ncbi:MAG: alpha/beta hydrolase [Flavobacteriaceae bacterium]|jgi:esterase/lipase
MRQTKYIALAIIILTLKLNAQNYSESNISINDNIYGSIVEPKSRSNSNLVIFIGGSGPIDRDGNQSFMKCDMFKKLAYSLSEKGISSFRYDKRVVTQIRKGKLDKKITFDDFVSDAIAIIDFFESKYNSIVIAGHSQGSLVGLLSIKEGVSGFISLSGAGRTIDMVIEDQISKTAPMLLEDTKKIFKILRSGKITEDFPLPLYSLFNIEIQPFMISWMQYDPKKIISKIPIPSLIINGDNDLQVDEKEAKLLYNSAQNSEILIVKNMNHVLVEIEGDELKNVKSYNNPELKISELLIEKMVEFIETL